MAVNTIAESSLLASREQTKQSRVSFFAPFSLVMNDVAAQAPRIWGRSRRSHVLWDHLMPQALMYPTPAVTPEDMTLERLLGELEHAQAQLQVMPAVAVHVGVNRLPADAPFSLGEKEVELLLRAEDELIATKYGAGASADRRGRSVAEFALEFGDRVIGALAGIAYDLSLRYPQTVELSKSAGRFMPHAAGEILECFYLDPNDHSEFLRLVHSALVDHLSRGGVLSGPWGAVTLRPDGLLRMEGSRS